MNKRWMIAVVVLAAGLGVSGCASPEGGDGVKPSGFELAQFEVVRKSAMIGQTKKDEALIRAMVGVTDVRLRLEGEAPGPGKALGTVRVVANKSQSVREQIEKLGYTVR